jgi:hypothetical protein
MRSVIVSRMKDGGTTTTTTRGSSLVMNAFIPRDERRRGRRA